MSPLSLHITVGQKRQFADTRTKTQKQSMAKLLKDLSARFPEARILGHRDLPGMRKDCLCNDIRTDQNAEKSFQKLNDMPEISGTIMQGG